MNHRSVFPLRMPQSVRQKIRDRASIENRTQTNLILEAIQQYMSNPANNLKLAK